MSVVEHQPPRVLLVDDVDAIRMLVRATLEPEFDVVGEASTGEEAIELAAELQPDAIVLDLNLPQVDGLQALTAIKSSTPAVVVCVLSGLPASAVAERADELGADGYVEKGAPLDALAGLLRRLLTVAD